MTEKILPINSTLKQRASAKLAGIPIKIAPHDPLPKPPWIRIKLSTDSHEIRVYEKVKRLLRERHLVTVCEEASCPNISECFSAGTATFMIMGDKCTRRCSFCDVAHGRPDPLDSKEPLHLAETVQAMGLKYVVITSVDRDDLKDGGAGHFVACVNAVRQLNPTIHIEILVPDFRKRVEKALDILKTTPVEVFNHNIETVPRLYKAARPGSDYQNSLNLLSLYHQYCPTTPTKSGIMLGLGETLAEVEQTLHDLRAHGVSGVTMGQYLSPSRYHMPVARYVTPDEFKQLAELAKQLGFLHVASGPLVRSSYHADKQANGEQVS